VVLGDSCQASTSNRYFSDRPIETVGRGGVIVMPWIDGLVELLPEGAGVLYYPPGNFRAMNDLVDILLDDVEEREMIRKDGQAHVCAHHTYAHRMQAVLDTLQAEGAFG
jgi:glycosyltransferase involved in cell wall biosynthesis